MRANLVFDIGANNGDDAAHYLARGFRVLAVEAAPDWAVHLAERFRGEIQRGELMLLECAIARREGLADFYVSEGNRGVWSSFDLERAGRDGVKTRSIQVRARTLNSIMDEYGVPFFLKVDIEGGDRICLDAIDPEDAPEFVSFEASEGKVADLYALHAKGYRRFRLIDQTTFARVPAPSLYSVTHALESVRHVLRQAVRRRKFAPPPPAALSIPGFNISSSGPMPHEHDAIWDEVDEVAVAWFHYVRGSDLGRWFDVHAAR
jgi:FkbM family methyltransferase